MAPTPLSPQPESQGVVLPAWPPAHPTPQPPETQTAAAARPSARGLGLTLGASGRRVIWSEMSLVPEEDTPVLAGVAVTHAHGTGLRWEAGSEHTPGANTRSADSVHDLSSPGMLSPSNPCEFALSGRSGDVVTCHVIAWLRGRVRGRGDVLHPCSALAQSLAPLPAALDSLGPGPAVGCGAKTSPSCSVFQPAPQTGRICGDKTNRPMDPADLSGHTSGDAVCKQQTSGGGLCLHEPPPGLSGCPWD